MIMWVLVFLLIFIRSIIFIFYLLLVLVPLNAYISLKYFWICMNVFFYLNNIRTFNRQKTLFSNICRQNMLYRNHQHPRSGQSLISVNMYFPRSFSLGLLISSSLRKVGQTRFYRNAQTHYLDVQSSSILEVDVYYHLTLMESCELIKHFMPLRYIGFKLIPYLSFGIYYLFNIRFQPMQILDNVLFCF